METTRLVTAMKSPTPDPKAGAGIFNILWRTKQQRAQGARSLCSILIIVGMALTGARREQGRALSSLGVKPAQVIYENFDHMIFQYTVLHTIQIP